MKPARLSHRALSLLALSLAAAACGSAPPPPPAAPKDVPAAPAPAKAEAPKPEAPKDALEAAPGVHKKVFENQIVRIFEITIKGGEKVPVHTHPDHVVYVVAGGKVKITDGAGEAKEVELKPGTALLQKALTHSAENLGTSDIKMAMFELKGRGESVAPKGAEPAAVSGKSFKALGENEAVRVFEVTYGKGQKLGRHVHPEHAVFVLSGGKVKLADAAKGKEGVQELELTPGFGGYLPAGERTVDNVGGSEVKLVVVEMKPTAEAIEAAKAAEKKPAKKP